MNRLIDADKLMEKINEYLDEYGEVDKDGNHDPKWCAVMEIKDVAEYLAVDVNFNDMKRVIRCKDCKHHRYDKDGIPYCLNIDYGYGWRDEDFCSYAERGERNE